MNRYALLSAASVVALTICGPALAQSETSGAGEGASLSEIVVTAQKREQSLQDVPISVSVVGAEAIERSSIYAVSDLPRLSPALTFTAGAVPAFVTFNIRGVGSYVYRIGVQPAVSVVVDGIPLARSPEFAAELGDISRTEILSGPQGTLFGRNSTGGVINLIRNLPTDTFEASISGGLTHGRLGETETSIRGVINAPLSDAARLRLYVFDRRNDGYIKNLYPGAKDSGAHHVYGVQTKLAVDVASNLDVLLSADYSRNFTRNGDPQILVPLQGYQQPNAPTIAAKEIALQQGAIGQRFAVNTPAPFNGVQRFGALTADVTWRLSDSVSVKSLTSYRKNTIEYFSNYYPVAASAGDPRGFDLVSSTTSGINPAAPRNRDIRWRHFTQEVRLQASTSFVDAVGGVYYNSLREHEIAELPRFQSATILGAAFAARVGTPTGPTAAFPYFYSNVFTDAVSRNETLAGFADLTLHLTEAIEVFAGYRYSYEKLSYDYTRLLFSNVPVQTGTNFNFATQTPTVAPLSLAFSGADKSSDWSGRVGGSLKITPRIKTYITYSRGYVGPGVDLGGGTAGTPANPERALLRASTSQSYEAGVKSELLDRRLRMNLAVFKQDTKDVQVAALIAGTATIVVQNAGNIEAKGVELNAEAQVTPAFSIALGAAYLDATFANLRQPCYPNQAVTGVGCVGGTQSVGGKRALNAPKYKLNITPNYNIELPNAPFDMYVRGDYQWKSKVWYQLDHDPLATQDAFAIINVSVGFVSKDKRYEARLFVDNLTNKYFCMNMVSGPAARQSCQSSPIDAQRRFGVSGTATF